MRELVFKCDGGCGKTVTMKECEYPCSHGWERVTVTLGGNSRQGDVCSVGCAATLLEIEARRLRAPGAVQQ